MTIIMSMVLVYGCCHKCHKYAMKYVPRYHNNKIHDVPHVPQVGVLVENESHRHYLGAHLHSEDSEEVRLQFVLKSRKFYFVLSQFRADGH